MFTLASYVYLLVWLYFALFIVGQDTVLTFFKYQNYKQRYIQNFVEHQRMNFMPKQFTAKES